MLNFVKEQIYFIFMVFVFLFFLLTFYFKFTSTTTNFIILFTFIYVINYIFIKYNYVEFNNSNEIIMYKLKSLQKTHNEYIDYLKLLNKTKVKYEQLDAIYIDADIINFLFRNIYLAGKSPEAFFNLLQNINIIFNIELELTDTRHILPENTQKLIQVALEKYTIALENLNSFIFRMDDSQQNNSSKILNDTINNFILLMNYHIKKFKNINENFIKIYGINNLTIMNLFPINAPEPINLKNPTKNIKGFTI